MEKLPPELLRDVLSYLQAPLASYATVNRAFQTLIEVRTFANIKTKSTNDDVRQFEAIFTQDNRRRAVKSLEFAVELPKIRDERLMRLQNKRESAENNRAYTTAVKALFERLSAWDDSSDHDALTSSFLTITSASPSDSQQPSELGYHERHAWEIRNHTKYIDLEGVQELPSIRRISSFTVEGRYIHPNAMATMVAAMPNLKIFIWWFYTAPRRMHALWASLRDAMACLVSVIANLSLLEDLILYCEDSDPLNHDWKPPSLVDCAGVDRLSVAFHKLSQLPRLRKLSLAGMYTISPDVFDLSAVNGWPSLERFEIDISMIAPNGTWYFTGVRSVAQVSEEDHSDSDLEDADALFLSDESSERFPRSTWEKLDGQSPCFLFRHHPDPATFDPLIIAMVRAVSKMPLLKEFGCDLPMSHVASIGYIGPSQRDRCSNVWAASSTQGHWHICLMQENQLEEETNWKPPQELVEVLEASNHKLAITRSRRTY
ncbi:hypothetical protein HJFPF1_04420 [Paramyrothecium foliicola]|nr:hypothetical protein HJFPF1_04420 [Paramyrothecium foliicola]